MTYWSQAWQDEFVVNLLNFKRNGYYLDIGSGPPDAQSNSYFFDSEMGWKGLCVEQSSDYVELYKQKRSCKFINGDATQLDYETILSDLEFPTHMDFLSVDTDENSAKCLSKLPLDKYRFDVVILEHDKYRLGDHICNEEREIMKHYGYHLLFGDVLVPLGCGFKNKVQPFEDWWVYLSEFNVDKLSKLAVTMSSKKLYPDEIVAELKKMNDVFIV